jgi:UDP-N-acetylglucosamine 2-epimerase
VSAQYPDVLFVYPVHLNPNVRKSVYRILVQNPRTWLIEPLPYASFVWLMDQATIILTDSGGVQEEAPALGKPILVMRNTTERPEGIESGNAKLVGVLRSQIADALIKLLGDAKMYAAMAKISYPFGKGEAAKKIVNVLMQL